MPSYDYYCPANARTVEVRHGMNDNLSTWGELCEKGRIDPGDTPPASPIRRLITGGAVIGAGGSAAASEPPPCVTHGRCACHP
jgi:hypothetical protein